MTESSRDAKVKERFDKNVAKKPQAPDLQRDEAPVVLS